MKRSGIAIYREVTLPNGFMRTTGVVVRNKCRRLKILTSVMSNVKGQNEKVVFSFDVSLGNNFKLTRYYKLAK